jgi:transcriptional regulator with XRE-family HTH domain
MMIGLSQEKVAHALGLTFQQVQKYEKGTNRVSSSRLHQHARILEVPIPFFFDGAPQQSARSQGKAESPNYVNDFLATEEGALWQEHSCESRTPSCGAASHILRNSLQTMIERGHWHAVAYCRSKVPNPNDPGCVKTSSRL